MIVFTDLDGTLLDHETYSFEAARPALLRLAAAGVPVVPATSKTAAEVLPLMGEIGLPGPAIVENGGGIARFDEAEEADKTYERIRETLRQIPKHLRENFSGFGDMDEAGVSQATGLPVQAARLARTRRYTEPGIFRGSEVQRSEFLAALGEKGLSARMGGRFLTLGYGDHSKADRMNELRRALGAKPPVVALGDAPNDREMLEAADIAIIVANPSHNGLDIMELVHRRVIRTEKSGPAGWNEAIQELLDETTAMPIGGS